MFSLNDRNEPKEQSQDTMRQMSLKATTKGAVVICIVLLYCSSLCCQALSAYALPVSFISLSIFLSFFKVCLPLLCALFVPIL